jgi:hypothetical protein
MSSFSRALRKGAGSGFPRFKLSPVIITSKQPQKNLFIAFSTMFRLDQETVANLKCRLNSLRQSRIPLKGFILSNPKASRFLLAKYSKCQGSGTLPAFSKIALIIILSFESDRSWISIIIDYVSSFCSERKNTNSSYFTKLSVYYRLISFANNLYYGFIPLCGFLLIVNLIVILI